MRIGENYIECHHDIPLHKLKPNTLTTIDDLRLVCANCHRMLHRNPYLHTNELKTLFGK